jgi:WhiB family redox-sensing transcriptional regulator
MVLACHGGARLMLSDADLWRDSALCAQTDPDLFFPEKSEHTKAKRAREVCQGCEAQIPCLAYALEHHTEGIWAGTSYKDRVEIRMGRRSA